MSSSSDSIRKAMENLTFLKERLGDLMEEQSLMITILKTLPSSRDIDSVANAVSECCGKYGERSEAVVKLRAISKRLDLIQTSLDTIFNSKEKADEPR